MSEAKWFGNKERTQKPELKLVGPSFEDLLSALPPEKRERLRALQDVPEQIAQAQGEDGTFEIYVDQLGGSDAELYEEFCALIGEARDILDAQPKTAVFGQE